MTISIEVEKEFNVDFDYEKLANDVIIGALDFENCIYEAEVNLLITGSEEIKSINKEFRDIDSATDVLSFPMVDYFEPGNFDFLEDADEYFNPETGELVLGDIIINVDRVFSQAEEFGHSVKREYAFLICHSMLHLMGYDHMEEDEAKIMENRQNEILNKLQIKRDL